ncbi:MAG: hypothetical protein AAF599_18550, partial [Bacteroidota bacterium]
LMEEDTIQGVQIRNWSNMNLELSIPIYLRYQLGNGLVLTGGLATNLSLASEYTLRTVERMGSRSGGSTGRSSNWLEGFQINGNIGLQVPVSDHADLRFNLQQPIWAASFKGLESGFYRFSNFRFTFGINYKLDRNKR